MHTIGRLKNEEAQEYPSDPDSPTVRRIRGGGNNLELAKQVSLSY